MRYITSNASSRIPIETQLIMWNMFDRMTIEKDYLQIFNLSSQGGIQKIRHSQEQPLWSEKVIYLTDNSVNEKVYIITENDYETMLLAEDY